MRIDSLNRNRCSLRRISQPATLNSDVMNSNILWDNSEKAVVQSYCEIGAKTSPILAPLSTISQYLAPFRSNFLPLFFARNGGLL
jgi:hypothetical protein